VRDREESQHNTAKAMLPRRAGACPGRGAWYAEVRGQYRYVKLGVRRSVICIGYDLGLSTLRLRC